MMQQDFDLVVIGGGPGGYVAAIRAAQLGMKTALVEAQHLGGICLNWGCIPTKALLRSAEIYHLVKHADHYGITATDVSFDIKKIVERSREVSGQLSQGIAHLMKKHHISVFSGYGTLNGQNKVKVTKEKTKIADLHAPHIIIATGARARTLPNLVPDGDTILTYKDAMIPDNMPKSLLVVGSGAIGMEFASFYHQLGVNVTVIELAERILPAEDEEISTLAKKIFTKQGMDIYTKAHITSVTKGKESSLQVTLEQDGKTTTLSVDRIITAVGIVPNTEHLCLEGSTISLDKGHIVTDEWSRTGEEGVYAIGDVTSGPWLAHKASHEAVICVEHIAGKTVTPLDKEAIPGCTYCSPQIASVGLTEAQAKSQGYRVKIGRFPYTGNGKAITMAETEGLIKTIFDEKTGAVLGAHMIGAEVTELISNFVLGKTMEATEEDFMHTIFPHPTLSEMLHESVLSAFGRALHI